MKVNKTINFHLGSSRSILRLFLLWCAVYDMLSILSLALGAASGLSSLHSTQIKELIKEPGKYGGSWPLWFICLSPASTHADRKTRFLNWLWVISMFPTESMAFQGLDKFDYHDEVQLSKEPNVWKDVWVDLSRRWIPFNTTIIHSRKHCQEPQKLGFCKFCHLGMTIPQNQSHAFSQKSPDMNLEKGRQELGTLNSPKLYFLCFKGGTITRRQST